MGDDETTKWALLAAFNYADQSQSQEFKLLFILIIIIKKSSQVMIGEKKKEVG